MSKQLLIAMIICGTVGLLVGYVVGYVVCRWVKP